MTEGFASPSSLPNALPSAWSWVQLGDLAPDFQNGASSRGVTGGDPSVVLRLADIKEGRITLDSARHLPLPRGSARRYRLSSQDLLVIRVNGSEQLVGRFVRGTDEPVAFCDHFIRMRFPDSVISPAYLRYLGDSPYVRSQIARHFVSTAGQLTINQDHLRSLRIPLPPVPEQERIVAAVEEEFARLHAAEAALRTAEVRLRKMDLANLQTLIGYGLQEVLPTGWSWATVMDVAGTSQGAVLTGPFGTALSRSDFVREGVPVLTIGCISPAGIDLAKAPKVSASKAALLEKYALQPGDVLFSRMATVGRAAVVREREAGSLINYHLMRLRLNPELLRPAFLVLLCRGSRAIQAHLKSVNHGVTRAGVNTKELLSMPVLLPPAAEQDAIIGQMDRQDEAIGRLQLDLDGMRTLSRTLTASILSAAFSGRLLHESRSHV